MSVEKGNTNTNLNWFLTGFSLAMWTRCIAGELCSRFRSDRNKALPWNFRSLHRAYKFPSDQNSSFSIFQLCGKVEKCWRNNITSRKGTRMGRFYIKRSREPNVKSCAPSRFQVYPGKLESVWILVIVWYPHFLMASCHFSSTVLQNQTLISEIPMIYVCFWASWSPAKNSWPCLFSKHDHKASQDLGLLERHFRVPPAAR